MPTRDRYTNKPLLRILECYVLSAIGELSNDQSEMLLKMEPQLRLALKQDGHWRELVEKAMELPSDMPELIRGNWEKNVALAQQQHVSISGQQFAEMFVDANFTT